MTEKTRKINLITKIDPMPEPIGKPVWMDPKIVKKTRKGLFDLKKADIKMVKTDFKKQGKKNRVAGAKFELEVRKDLEEKGWICSKWQNNVEFERIIDESEKRGEGIFVKKMHMEGKLIPAKRKFNPFRKVLGIGTGFPDFIVYTPCKGIRIQGLSTFDINGAKFEFTPFMVFGVEAKLNGRLDKDEREKCKWLIENKIFSGMMIAKKGEKKQIIYEEFK